MTTGIRVCERCGHEATVSIIHGKKYFDCPECGKYEE